MYPMALVRSLFAWLVYLPVLGNLGASVLVRRFRLLMVGFDSSFWEILVTLKNGEKSKICSKTQWCYGKDHFLFFP